MWAEPAAQGAQTERLPENLGRSQPRLKVPDRGQRPGAASVVVEGRLRVISCIPAFEFLKNLNNQELLSVKALMT